MRSLFAMVLVCCIIAGKFNFNLFYFISIKIGFLRPALGSEENIDSTKEPNGLLVRFFIQIIILNWNVINLIAGRNEFKSWRLDPVRWQIAGLVRREAWEDDRTIRSTGAQVIRRTGELKISKLKYLNAHEAK
jgi:hypothetical protein